MVGRGLGLSEVSQVNMFQQHLHVSELLLTGDILMLTFGFLFAVSCLLINDDYAQLKPVIILLHD